MGFRGAGADRLALLAGLPAVLGAAFIAAGSLGLLALFGVILPRAPARFLLTMALGALAWLAGNLLWLAGQSMAQVSLWWVAFLVLTIAGERLELGRLRQLPPHALWAFTAAVITLLAGLGLSAIALGPGTRLVGTGMLLLSVWLLRYDIARRTIRKPGLPRFSASCILSGSLWLGVSGLIALAAGAQYAGPLYDALLHTLFVGFVFAMIFGHAPIILPAVLDLPVAFLRAAYNPFGGESPHRSRVG